VYKLLRGFIFTSSKDLHFVRIYFRELRLSKYFARGFIFAKQTRYGIKQESNGPKMNGNFT